jgi:TRAP-type transport system small permease protein
VSPADSVGVSVARVIDLYCRFLKFCIAACLAVMVVLVFGNVVLRYGFNSGITISEELSRWLLVWLTFLGAIVALRDHSHLGVDSLVRVLPPLGKRICFVLSYVLMLYADWLLLAGSWKQMLITASDRAPATQLSVGIFYATGVVFGVSAAVILFHDLWRVLTGVASEEEMVAVAESEELPPTSSVLKSPPT